MKLGEEEWIRWAGWAQRVKQDVQTTVNDQAIFMGFSEIVRENEEWIGAHHGAYFCQFVARAYASRVAMGVRRHVKVKKDSISLGRILEQMKECAPQLTFDFFLARFPETSEEDFPWQKPTFKSISDDGLVASRDIIAADIDRMDALTAGVESFADKQLAHLDNHEFAGNVTFNELGVAVETLDEVACKYICLLTGKGYASLKATVQFDWTTVFDVPLRKPPL